MSVPPNSFPISSSQRTDQATASRSLHGIPEQVAIAPDEDANSSASNWLRARKVVLRRLPAIVWTTDRSLRVTSAGGAAFGETPAPSESWVGRLVTDCFTDDASTEELMNAHVTTLQGEQSAVDLLWRRKAYRLYIEPLLAKSGAVEGCVGMAVDITPRRHTEQLFSAPGHTIGDGADFLAKVQHRLRTELEERRSEEQKLRESQERLFQLAADIDSATWIFDLRQERVVYLSPGYERIWGIPVETAMQSSEHPIHRGLHPDDRGRVVHTEVLQRQGRLTLEEFRIGRADGAQRWISARAFPIIGSGGQVERIAGIAEDITPRKQDEQQDRCNDRLATLGNFAAGIAHEVNNPLGAALAATQAALAILPHDASALLHECLDTTLLSIRRCSDVVKSLLHFCREEPAQKQTVDLRDVLNFAVKITRSYARDHGAELQYEPADHPLEIVGNRIELEILAVNLLRNAVEARATLVRVKVNVAGNHLELQVIDNGVGIPEADAWHICEPFYTTRRDRGGTGLGLSIVHGIVQQHGGRLQFRRNSQRGTVVAVQLPIAVSAPSSPLSF